MLMKRIMPGNIVMHKFSGILNCFRFLLKLKLFTGCFRLVLLIILLSSLSAHADLIGHWTFDDTLNDSAGSVHGSFSDGSPTYVTGKYDNAIRLDGVNDHVVFGTSGNYNFGSGTDFSVALWIKTTGSSSDIAIISNKDWTYGSNVGWVIHNHYGSGKWGWNYRGADASRVDYASADNYINDNQWHHLCVTHDRDGLAKFYFDGDFEGQVDISVSSGTIDAGYPTVLGTDGAQGTVWDYWMPGDFDDVRIYDHVLNQTEIDQLQGDSTTVEIEVGPYVQFTSPYSAVVYWDTAQPCDSIVEYGTTESLGLRTEDSTPTNQHQVTLENLQYRTKYFYRVGGTGDSTEVFSDTFTFDNAINYTRMDCSDVASPYEVDSFTPLYEAAAQNIADQTGITKGFCLVYGCGEGRLAFELAKRTGLTIVGVDTDSADVQAARNHLMSAGVYGARVKILYVDSLESLNFTKYFFNLIVSDDMISQGTCPGSATEAFRVLRPAGGAAYFGQPEGCPIELTQTELESWLDLAGLTYTTTDDTNGLWSKVVRNALIDAGQWPRQYGRADNACYDKEELEGATRTNELTIQWLGSPGADFGADRNPRMPSPVMAGATLYHTGLDRLIAVDSYNGFINWSLEIPGFMRVNTPRDGGYYCAQEDCIFTALDDDCLLIDSITGIRNQTYKLDDDGFEWGYVAVSDDKIYGSAQYDGAHYTEFWGGAAWYDATSGSATEKVCSKYIFANDKTTGSRIWTYSDGVIINSTITIGGGRVYFVESRNNTIRNYTSGRIGLSELWSDQYIVALDEDTGEQLWEEPINTADGIVVFYMQYRDERLFIMSSATSYNIYAHDASNGDYIWSQNHAWPSDNHGGHMQHPVIVGSTIYLEPNGYNTSTGSLVTASMGRHEGCATYAGTVGALIYRGSGRRVAMWDINSGSVTVWNGLRPSCWLSTIPAGGMVLSPEGGGGCSCNIWINTSIGFIKED
jgi:ubiquinone/menaquinone biosynthesis C-methylase UbiE